MLKFKNSGLLVLIFSLVGAVSAKLPKVMAAKPSSNTYKVITVVQPSFKNIGGGLGLDDVTISSPSLKTQISSIPSI